MSFSRPFQGGGGRNHNILEHPPSISVIVPESPEAPVARKIISTTNRKQVHIQYISLFWLFAEDSLLRTSKPCIDNKYFIQRSHRECLVIWKIISVEMQQIVKVLTLFAIPKYLKTLHSQTKYTPLINGPDQKIQKRVYKILLYQVSPKMCL